MRRIGEARLHDHLARELHAARAQAEVDDRVLAEAADAAVEVAHRRAEEQAAEARQHRVADPAVQPRHRARLDPTGEAVAHHEVVAVAQVLEERAEVLEVVAVVGVGHDHVGAARGCPGSTRCRSPCGARSRPRARRTRELGRVVGAAVVGDDHFAGDARFAQPGHGLADAQRRRFRLRSGTAGRSRARARPRGIRPPPPPSRPSCPLRPSSPLDANRSGPATQSTQIRRVTKRHEPFGPYKSGLDPSPLRRRIRCGER